ncbi:MAG TPA: bifunctional alpha,alpha-trehalose-phosphate synthase (UDP-forming)/trehalose-phosphatase [Candidatus Saccharimonadales bacterium]|nr:bifunctional alpha,alpha-trehalose-phosphate synthase (UDP-forming)/trehalose-phosphatase [Candidatus Saccharimonadales bacterium]
MPNLVIVSNRLPVSVARVNGKLQFGQGMGGLATGLSGYTKQRGTKWIGWPGIPSDDLTEQEQAQITRELRRQHCYPVFLTRAQIGEYYNGYSNSVLWPLLHTLEVKPYPLRLWKAYRKVNGIFADEVLRLSKPGSTIWVHDYQLMLVPQMLRRAGRDDHIGFFLHIPFPEPAVFRTDEEAKSLLRGMLGADLVGFHTRGYTRQFLAACDELLGLRSETGTLLIGQRPVQATEFPMGIDYGRFAAATRLRSKHREVRRLRKEFKGNKVIVTVDRLDPTKGLTERLQAYQLLLRQQPKWLGKLAMVMIVAPSRTDIDAYKSLKDRLDTILGEIENEFARENWQPVHFIYEPVPLERVMSFYQLADVAFIAPIRDGMNLVAKEFIASKRFNNGVLVLSETAGAAEELHDAIQVNPAQPQTMVDGLSRALEMPKRELRQRARAMQERVQEYTVQKWADNFMDVLQASRSLAPRRTRTLNPSLEHDLLRGYHHAQHRVLLLDYDGVLRKIERDPAKAAPTPELLRTLKNLAANPKNEVVIVSGRAKEDLVGWLGHLPIGIAAEHGALFRRRGGKTWHSTSTDARAWKPYVANLFQYYADQTPGAHVENKEWSVVWHYRRASPYYAQKNLVALRRLLKPLLRQYGLTLEEGRKILEVRPAGVHKGQVIKEWLIHDHDFLLAAGDDVTDEAMFTILPPKAYSIKVGAGSTQARFRVANVPIFLQLLEKLAKD